MIISKKGSLYKLAYYANGMKDIKLHWDICSFTKQVLKGFVAVLFFSVLFTIILIPVLMPFFYLMMWAITGVVLEEAFIIILTLIGVVIVSVLIYYTWQLLWYAGEKAKHKLETVEFVQTTYKSYKEKICFLVDIK